MTFEQFLMIRTLQKLLSIAGSSKNSALPSLLIIGLIKFISNAVAVILVEIVLSNPQVDCVQWA